MSRFALLLGAIVAAAVIVGLSLTGERREYPFESDLHDYYYPTYVWVAQEVRTGNSPWWDATRGGGLDRLSVMQSEILYPPMWLMFVSPTPEMLSAILVLHLISAGLGVAYWSRARGTTLFQSLLIAATYQFGIHGEAWWPPILHTLSWTPWILFAIETASRDGRSSFRIAAVAMSLQALAGYPQMAYYGFAFCALYAAWKAWHVSSAAPLRVLCLSAIVGGSIAAIQLLPTATLLRDCNRGEVLQAEDVHYLTTAESQRQAGDLAIIGQSCLRLFGYDSGRRPASLTYRDSYGYLGIQTAVILTLCFSSVWTSRKVFLVGVGLLGMVLSRGFYSSLPIYDALHSYAPLFGSFRTPDRLLIFTLLSLVGLLQDGVATWSQHAGVRWRYLLASAIAVLAILAASEDTTAQLRLSLFLGTSLAIVLTLGRAQGRYRNVMWIVLCGIQILDLGFATGRVMPVSVIDDTAQPQLVAPRSAKQKFPVANPEQVAAISDRDLTNRLYVFEPYFPVMPSPGIPEFNAMPFYEAMFPARHRELYLALPRTRMTRLDSIYLGVDPSRHPRWFDWTSNRFLLADERYVSPASGWTPVDMVNERVLFENPHYIPRASLFGDFVVATPEEARAWLAETRDDGPDVPRLESSPSEAWLRGRAAEAAELRDTSRATAATPNPDRVRWITSRNDQVVLETDAAGHRLLLLTDNWAPGWRVTVDNQPAEIVRANVMHRAVELTPGTHIVEFRYFPAGLWTGMWISGLGLCAFWGVGRLLAGQKVPSPDSQHSSSA